VTIPDDRAARPWHRFRRRAARHHAALLSLAGAAQAAACARGAAHATSRAPTSAPRALALRDVAIPGASGSVLHAAYATGVRGRGAVLLLHGVGASGEAMHERARFLHATGFSVLVPDFRAHGASTGGRTTYGALESRDAAAALAFLRAQACGERVGVIGVSMGGAAALLGEGPLPVEAMVLESVYPTIRDATADRLGTWLGPIGFAGRWATPVALRWIGWRTGVRESELRPIDRIAAVHAPLLVIAGTADPYTPMAETRALFGRAPAASELWPVEGARHEDLHAYAGEEYERRVGEFLARHLALPGGGRLAARPVRADAEQDADPRQAPQCLDHRERQGDR
jgi:fermentation-respiration switch protein FrsA (DUF1100 family)